MALAFAPSGWKSQIDLARASVRICWDLDPRSNWDAEMLTSKWNTVYIPERWFLMSFVIEMTNQSLHSNFRRLFSLLSQPSASHTMLEMWSLVSASGSRRNLAMHPDSISFPPDIQHCLDRLRPPVCGRNIGIEIRSGEMTWNHIKADQARRNQT
jgi:hypothetical protein